MWNVYTSLEQALEDINYIKRFNISTKIKKINMDIVMILLKQLLTGYSVL
jgi:hypothetical protein